MSDSQTATAPLVVTPSERVLLFGDRFTPAARRFCYKEEVLSSGAKVDAYSLAIMVLAAAFLADEQAGAIRLELHQGKTMFGLKKTENLVAARGEGRVPWPGNSLESEIATTATRETTVEFLVSRILNCLTESPGQKLCARVKENLAVRGVLHWEHKQTLKFFTTVTYSLPEPACAAEQAGTAHVEQFLKSYRQQRPQIWAMLTRAISCSIVSQTWLSYV